MELWLSCPKLEEIPESMYVCYMCCFSCMSKSPSTFSLPAASTSCGVRLRAASVRPTIVIRIMEGAFNPSTRERFGKKFKIWRQSAATLILILTHLRYQLNYIRFWYWFIKWLQCMFYEWFESKMSESIRMNEWMNVTFTRCDELFFLFLKPHGGLDLVNTFLRYMYSKYYSFNRIDKVYQFHGSKEFSEETNAAHTKL